MGSYTDALAKDLKRLTGELEKLTKAMKKNKDDANSKKALDKLKPFLTKDFIEKRFDMAKKMDGTEMGKLIKDAGLPW